MEKNIVEKHITLDLQFCKNCVNALEDLKTRIKNNLKDNQLINVIVSKALTDNHNVNKWACGGVYCGSDYEGLSLKVECTNYYTIHIRLINKNDYDEGYCNLRDYDFNYQNGDKVRTSIWYTENITPDKRLRVDELINEIDYHIEHLLERIDSYSSSIKLVDDYIKDKEQLESMISKFESKYKDIPTYDFKYNHYF